MINITGELVRLLRHNKGEAMPLRQLLKESEALADALKLGSRSWTSRIKAAILPYLGDELEVKETNLTTVLVFKPSKPVESSKPIESVKPAESAKPVDQNITDAIVKVLNESGECCLPIGQLGLEKSTRQLLKLRRNSSAEQIEQAILPHLGDVLEIRESRWAKYVSLRQADETLLLSILRKFEGCQPSVIVHPFEKSRYLSLLNRMVEQHIIHVKLDESYVPLIYIEK